MLKTIFGVVISTPLFVYGSAAANADGSRDKTPSIPGQSIEKIKAEQQETTPTVPQPPPKLYHPQIQMLGAVASLRKDELTGVASWEEGGPYSLKHLWDLPDWMSLTLEERVRYESYAIPWIKDDTVGQNALNIQSVVWFQARPSENFRYEIHFWDARQYGSNNPNNIDTTMVNVLNLEQIFLARIDRNLFNAGLDSEIKLGQMQMGVGSNRLIGIVPYKSTQFQYVGLQHRLTDSLHNWELLTFANTPVNMLPGTPPQITENRWVWNRPITDSVFAGLFATRRLSARDHGELYFYYLQEGETTATQPTLYTPGFRFFRDPKKNEFDYEIETVGQTGQKRVNSQSPVLSVGSVMQHIQLGYTFDAPWTPRLLLQWDYASSHFDSLFPSTVSEFGPDGILALFARNNLNTPGYRIFLQPTQDVFFYAANRFWWLADSRSTQGWDNANLVDTTGQSGNYIGQTWELNARWDVHDQFAVQAGWQVLMKGTFAESAPGAPLDHGNVNYWFVQTQFRL